MMPKNGLGASSPSPVLGLALVKQTDDDVGPEGNISAATESGQVTVKIAITHERFLSTDFDVIPRYANPS
jgi:hypothetical protein